MQEIKAGIYKHAKSGMGCKVYFVAKHSESLEDMVVYEDLSENELSKFWVRPASMWNEEVEVDGAHKNFSSKSQGDEIMDENFKGQVKKPRFEWQGE